MQENYGDSFPQVTHAIVSMRQLGNVHNKVYQAIQHPPSRANRYTCIECNQKGELVQTKTLKPKSFPNLTSDTNFTVQTLCGNYGHI